ncbi:L-type lectin family protein [Levilactobacillus cerevisiae]|uniref:hypothetical protein n=1 Tax=Levilactobacillus cerevisiae TaxID=1704076 RepID=UPI000F795337|nr:hypothetical protein [Levilactobacillus cerevisiae]
MKVKKILLGMIIVIIGISLSWGAVGHAESELSLALRKAPRGVKIDEYFKFGSFAGNSASLAATDYGEKQAVQLTSDRNQLGTIWTSDASKMSLNKDETASMWMYFGNGGNFAGDTGDGMAFVMQNDNRGTEATSVDTSGNPSHGETLGVWGDDTNNGYTDNVALAKSAVQNSWALEFDTYVNIFPSDSQQDMVNVIDKGLPTFFDYDFFKTAPHIASAYPGKPDTYDIKYVGTTGRHYAKMNHNGVLTSDYYTYWTLTDAAWHHVTLDWNHTKKTMTYTFNDKPPVSTTGQSTDKELKSYTAQLDLDELDPKKTGKIRWGFTGSTGASYETNLVVFEKVPGIVNAESTAQLTNTTTGKKVTSNDSVNAGDRLQLDYDLRYLGGQKSWNNIVANLKLPKNVTFTSGTVTYQNGKQETIDLTQLDGQDLKTTLGQNLSENNATATLSLQGKATSTSSNGTSVAVAATTSNFIGDNAVTAAPLNGFKVRGTVSYMSIALTGNSINGETSVSAGKSVSLTGKVTYDRGYPDSNANIKLHGNLNGRTLPVTALSNSDQQGVFTYTVPSTALLDGPNRLTLYASDKNGNTSRNDVQYVITLGSLKLTVASRVAFTGTLTGAQQELTSPDSWDVNVTNSLGSGINWTLQAAASKFTTGADGTGMALPANLIYQDGEKTANLSQGTEELVHDDAGGVTNVSQNWHGRRGLFLRVGSGAMVGNYRGTVTWSLVNSVQ